jgi:hypothetical protein
MFPAHPQHRAIVLLVSLAALASTLPGCGRDSPTEPRRVTAPSPISTPNPAPATNWSAFWTFDGAEPAGDCLVDALKDAPANGGMQNWRFGLTVEREGEAVRLLFDSLENGRPSEGFWPVVFAGTVSADGRVSATVPATALGAVRTDPWLELCYWSWSTEGGELTAELSADGRRLDGSIVERFRVVSPPGGPTFTIRSHFTATAP